MACVGVAVSSAMLLAGCGGGANATIGGSVSGLNPGTSVALQNDGADNIVISANEAFSFPTQLAPGEAYSVTVASQPVGQNCVVANGAGLVDSIADDVNNVALTCSLSSSVGGTVSGLAVGNSVWLANHGQSLPIAANGPFAFPGILTAGSAYDVTVAAQPAQQTCTIAYANGVVAAGVMASVLVACQ